MKRKLLHSLIAGTTIMTFVGPAYTLSALAQPQLVSPQASQESVIPRSTAITVTFPTTIEIDAGQSQEYPTSMLLVQPIIDSNGNPVAPQNSHVSVRLKPTQGGVKVIAESVVIGGRVVPIQASSPMIPGRTITVKSGNQQAQENSPVFSSLLGSIIGFVSGGELTQQAEMLGTGIGVITGLTSAKKARMVQIPQGSTYVLTLEAPITLTIPPQPAQN